MKETGQDRCQNIKYLLMVNGLGHITEVLVSQFNGTSTPKGSYSAKTGDNNCNANSSCYSLSTALCESNSLSGEV